MLFYGVESANVPSLPTVTVYANRYSMPLLYGISLYYCCTVLLRTTLQHRQRGRSRCTLQHNVHSLGEGGRGQRAMGAMCPDLCQGPQMIVKEGPSRHSIPERVLVGSTTHGYGCASINLVPEG